MLSKLKGAVLTLRLMGPTVLAKETLRRLLGVEYSYRGVRVRDSETFHLLRTLAGRYRLWERDGKLYLDLGYGIVSIPSEDIKGLVVDTIREGLYRLYEALNFKDSIVVDIGAYIGDTAIFFAARGARLVHAYEPIERFYRILLENIKLNKLEGKVMAYNAGVWYRDATLVVNKPINRSITPSVTVGSPNRAPAGVKVADLAKVLHAAREKGERVVVKMDCEGCEYSILTKPCKVIKLAEEYLVEIHGLYNVLTAYMEDCGYRAELLEETRPRDPGISPLTLWLFKLE